MRKSLVNLQKLVLENFGSYTMKENKFILQYFQFLFTYLKVDVGFKPQNS
jgi:hypothetical protein